MLLLILNPYDPPTMIVELSKHVRIYKEYKVFEKVFNLYQHELWSFAQSVAKWIEKTLQRLGKDQE